MVLIIGYGNPLRGDDGAGWRAAQAIMAAELPGVEVLTRHQLTPELAEAIAHADLVIFIDALSGDNPGIVSCNPVATATTVGPLVHHVTPAYLLAIAQTLYGANPPTFAITIGGLKFDYDEQCSLEVECALQEVLRLVDELIAQDRMPFLTRR